MRKGRGGKFTAFLFVIAWIVLLAGIASVRWELLPLAPGLLITVAGAFVLSLYGLFLLPVVLLRSLFRRQVASSTLGYCVFGLLPVGFLLFSVGPEGLTSPAIHDITTDTVNPPRFVLAGKDRGEGDHPVEYEGDVIARIQEDAYPHIEPLIVKAEPQSVLDAAVQVAKEKGYRILGVRPEEQTFEAVATTTVFGFKDDIAVRVTAAEPSGARVDIRSASRVGRSDLGANARRISEFKQALAEKFAK